jgi:NitT/TauT family transport system ATP-binding protein
MGAMNGKGVHRGVWGPPWARAASGEVPNIDEIQAGGGQVPSPGAAANRQLIEVDDLQVAYGQGRAATTAIESITLSVTAGELLCLVGPSGCGKTTLLRCVAGLQRPTGGTVRFDKETVVRPPAGMAVVFQDYARSLYPWLTVHDNVLLPLRRDRRRDRRDRDERSRASRISRGARAPAPP